MGYQPTLGYIYSFILVLKKLFSLEDGATSKCGNIRNTKNMDEIILL